MKRLLVIFLLLCSDYVGLLVSRELILWFSNIGDGPYYSFAKAVLLWACGVALLVIGYRNMMKVMPVVVNTAAAPVGMISNLVKFSFYSIQFGIGAGIFPIIFSALFYWTLFSK